MSYPRYEVVAWSHMHHFKGTQEAYRWMDKDGRPTEKIKIVRTRPVDGDDSARDVTTFDGETAWSSAIRHWNEVLHWSNNWLEIPMHPPLYEDDDINAEGITS